VDLKIVMSIKGKVLLLAVLFLMGCSAVETIIRHGK
jgi:hypothetical protein